MSSLFAKEPGDTIGLPPAPGDGEMSLEKAVWGRRSVRSFGREEPAVEIAAGLLWAAQGITEPGIGLRSAPSAGATYPLELFLATEWSLSRYIPEEHALVVTKRGDVRGALASAALDQSCVGGAPLVFVFAADVSRTAARYGDRADVYVPIEVGCAAENLMLKAVAQGWGGVAVGAFDDEDVSRVLDLPKGWRPYLIVPVGKPAR